MVLPWVHADLTLGESYKSIASAHTCEWHCVSRACFTAGCHDHPVNIELGVLFQRNPAVANSVAVRNDFHVTLWFPLHIVPNQHCVFSLVNAQRSIMIERTC